MRKSNKKGFTIVELVIVIAVIAILAAVLIPTFISLTKKANLSADEQAVNQMNKALAIYTAENGKPKSLSDVKAGLSENGINADSIAPVTQGYAFYWNPTENTIELVGEDKKSESGWLLLSSTGSYGVAPTTPVTDVETLLAAIEQSATGGTVLVKLENDITISADMAASGKAKAQFLEIFLISEGQSLILDMNGHSITSEVEKTNLFNVVKGQLVVKNATIDAKFCAFRNENGSIRLENVTLNKEGDNAAIHVTGLSDTTIVDSYIKSNRFAIATNNSVPENSGARISVIHSTVETTDNTKGGYSAIDITTWGNIIIQDSIIKGGMQAAYLRGCNATITNSTFTRGGAEGNEWGGGNNGPAADLILACGGTGYDTYTKNVTINCSNVTANTIIVHEPEGGKVTVTGIEKEKITHTCHNASGETCTGND